MNQPGTSIDGISASDSDRKTDKQEKSYITEMDTTSVVQQDVGHQSENQGTSNSLCPDVFLEDLQEESHGDDLRATDRSITLDKNLESKEKNIAVMEVSAFAERCGSRDDNLEVAKTAETADREVNIDKLNVLSPQMTYIIV